MSQIAFGAHHAPKSVSGCGGETSVNDCPSKKCVERATGLIGEILAYADVLAELLPPDDLPYHLKT